MRRFAAVVFLILGFASAAIGLAWLAGGLFITVMPWTWHRSDDALMFHDSYFTINDEPVSATVFFVALFAPPVALMAVGGGLLLLGRTCWNVRHEQREVAARPS